MAVSSNLTTGQVLTASTVNTYMLNPGLDFVKQVTVSAGASTVDITSCFSSTWDNYVISFANISCSGSMSISGALLSGSTPTSSGWVGTEFFVASGATGINGQLSASGGGSVFCQAGAALSGLQGDLTITSPFLAKYTALNYQVTASDYYRWGYGLHCANTSYNGIRFTTTGGTTITGGTITVYGRRKQ
jgi:hypothetical protein